MKVSILFNYYKCNYTGDKVNFSCSTRYSTIVIGMPVKVLALIFPMHSTSFDSFIILGFIPKKKSQNHSKVLLCSLGVKDDVVVTMISCLTVNQSPSITLEVIKDVFDHYQCWLKMLQNRECIFKASFGR